MSLAFDIKMNRGWAVIKGALLAAKEARLLAKHVLKIISI